MTSSPVPGPDLSGWKEIAAYLGRSVRTVQRWERELGLPVRRAQTPTGDAVYASRAELDAWLTSRAPAAMEDNPPGFARHNKPSAPTATPPTTSGPSAPASPAPAPEAPPRPTRSLRLPLLILALVAVCAAWWFLGRPKGSPARYAIEDGALVVKDAAGRPLWRHYFPFPVDAEHLRPAYVRGTGIESVAFRDIDGDGRVEVLATPRNGQQRELYCLESDGSVRFRHSLAARMQYGADAYGPPWQTAAVLPGARAGVVWAVSFNTFFPSVVEKLTAQGEVQGAYWLAGHPNALLETELDGRRVLLVGSTRNEDFTAALSVLDADNPSGSAPADDERYRCSNCPPLAPLAFLTFPRVELGRLASSRTNVLEIRRLAEGLMVLVSYPPSNPAPAPGDPACPAGAAWYHLDEQLQLQRVEFVDGYASCHDTLQAEGRVDHAFGARDKAELLAVRTWRRGVYSK